MPEPQDDQFLQRRLLLASVVSFAVIMAWSWFGGAQRAVPPEPGVGQSEPLPPAQPAAQTPAPADTPQDAPPPEDPADSEQAAETVQAEAERDIVVKTDSFEVVFSNRGAVVKRWLLKDFQDATKGEMLDVMHPEGAAEFGRPFTLLQPGGGQMADLDQALFSVNADRSEVAAPVDLVFEYAVGGKRARKTFHFEKEGYEFTVETELTENGVPRPHLIAWPGGFGDTSQLQDYLYSQSYYLDPVEGVERIEADDAEDARISNQGPYPFVGIDDLFFTLILRPEPEGRQTILETAAIEIAPDPEYPDTKQLFAAIAVGSPEPGPFRAYLGPKSLDELRAVDQRMTGIVDWGFFSFIAQPVFLMMRWVHDNVVANWGWSIVIVTVFINFALFPLKWKSSKGMKRMQKIQPQIKQINDKYKGMGMRDPRKQKQQEELMALYSKYGVNPVGSCFPILLQLPFFWGFYKVLSVAIEMRQAGWLWVDDLSRPEQLAIRVLPLAMIGTQFWMQSLTPTPAADPAQVRLMKFMPLMMGFIFYGFQAGLVLYWLTSNLVGVAQQVLLNKLPTDDDIQIEPPKKRGSGSKKKK